MSHIKLIIFFKNTLHVCPRASKIRYSAPTRGFWQFYTINNVISLQIGAPDTLLVMECEVKNGEKNA